jgi:hypothetical protein
MPFFLSPFQRVVPTRNKTDLYLQIAKTVTDFYVTKLPAQVTPCPAVLYAPFLKEIIHHNPHQYWAESTIHRHYTTPSVHHFRSLSKLFSYSVGNMNANNSVCAKTFKRELVLPRYLQAFQKSVLTRL